MVLLRAARRTAVNYDRKKLAAFRVSCLFGDIISCIQGQITLQVRLPVQGYMAALVWPRYTARTHLTRCCWRKQEQWHMKIARWIGLRCSPFPPLVTPIGGLSLNQALTTLHLHPLHPMCIQLHAAVSTDNPSPAPMPAAMPPCTLPHHPACPHFTVATPGPVRAPG